MLGAAVSGAFRRDMKACARRHWDMDELREVMRLVCEDTEQSRTILVRDYRDHALRGNWSGARECHVADLGDWILIYAVSRGEGLVRFVGTGSHDQFFKARGHAGRWPA